MLFFRTLFQFRLTRVARNVNVWYRYPINRPEYVRRELRVWAWQSFHRICEASLDTTQTFCYHFSIRMLYCRGLPRCTFKEQWATRQPMLYWIQTLVTVIRKDPLRLVDTSASTASVSVSTTEKERANENPRLLSWSWQCFLEGVAHKQKERPA